MESIEGLPPWAQVVAMMVFGVGAGLAMLLTYLRRIPNRPAEKQLAVAGALISDAMAERIINAVDRLTDQMMMMNMRLGQPPVISPAPMPEDFREIIERLSKLEHRKDSE